jgi:hypothetical protein
VNVDATAEMLGQLGSHLDSRSSPTLWLLLGLTPTVTNDRNFSGFRIAAFSIDRIQGYPVGASIGLKVTPWQSRCSEKPEAARRWLAPQLWPKDS